MHYIGTKGPYNATALVQSTPESDEPVPCCVHCWTALKHGICQNHGCEGPQNEPKIQKWTGPKSAVTALTMEADTEA